jgi:hypothetical protein
MIGRGGRAWRSTGRSRREGSRKMKRKSLREQRRPPLRILLLHGSETGFETTDKRDRHHPFDKTSDPDCVARALDGQIVAPTAIGSHGRPSSASCRRLDHSIRDLMASISKRREGHPKRSNLLKLAFSSWIEPLPKDPELPGFGYNQAGDRQTAPSILDPQAI